MAAVHKPGRTAAVALDLVEAALGRIGVVSTTTIVDAAQFTSSLLTGEFDGSAAAWKDADRERVLLFSQPYLENRLILVGRKGADVSAATMAALKGKRVALVEGYSYGEAADGAGPTFVRATSEEDCLSRLLAGAADYILMDDLVVQYIVDHHTNEARSKLQFGSTPLVTRPLYFAVRRSRPDAQSIVDGFNTQIRGMISDTRTTDCCTSTGSRRTSTATASSRYVPKSDDAATAPERAYSLFTVPTPAPSSPSSTSQPRFYIGGNIYRDWATVPDHDKLTGVNSMPNPARSTGTVFRFAW